LTIEVITGLGNQRSESPRTWAAVLVGRVYEMDKEAGREALQALLGDESDAVRLRATESLEFAVDFLGMPMEEAQNLLPASTNLADLLAAED
jgi:hypothetical protein